MDIRRRPPKPCPPSAFVHSQQGNLKASDALPLPLYLTNGIFFTLFFSVAYYLLHRWRDKIRTSTPLHVLTLSELAAILSLIASFIYLLGFFGIDFVQSFISPPRSSSDHDDPWDDVQVDQRQTNFILHRNPDHQPHHHHHHQDQAASSSLSTNLISMEPAPGLDLDDEDLVNSVVSGTTPSYSLESILGDCLKAASIRREAVQRITGKSLAGMPLDGFDYDAILGQCCEMPVGYVQIPVGIAGPLLMNGCEYSVPMATTEGCLVASTNRGCKAIHASGGATSILFRDGMTRAPVVRFPTAKRATLLKFFLEDPLNFETLALVFNK